MLIETLVRIGKSDGSFTYEKSLVNTAITIGVFPSEIEGVLNVVYAKDLTFMVKDKIESFLTPVTI